MKPKMKPCYYIERVRVLLVMIGLGVKNVLEGDAVGELTVDFWECSDIVPKT